MSDNVILYTLLTYVKSNQQTTTIIITQNTILQKNDMYLRRRLRWPVLQRFFFNIAIFGTRIELKEEKKKKWCELVLKRGGRNGRSK